MADLKALVKSVAKPVVKAVGNRVRGYKLDYSLGAGPRFYISLEGAHGDITALRMLKQKLNAVLPKVLDKSDVPAEAVISAVNTDDGNLLVEVALKFL